MLLGRFAWDIDREITDIRPVEGPDRTMGFPAATLTVAH